MKTLLTTTLLSTAAAAFLVTTNIESNKPTHFVSQSFGAEDTIKKVVKKDTKKTKLYKVKVEKKLNPVYPDKVKASDKAKEIIEQSKFDQINAYENSSIDYLKDLNNSQNNEKTDFEIINAKRQKTKITELKKASILEKINKLKEIKKQKELKQKLADQKKYQNDQKKYYKNLDTSKGKAVKVDFIMDDEFYNYDAL